MSAVDVVPASSLLALAQIELWLPHAVPGTPTPAQILATAALTAPLVWWRRAPIVAGLGVLVVFALQPILMEQPNLLSVVAAVMLSIFGIAAYSMSLLAAVVGGAAAVALSVLWAALSPAP